MPDPDVRVVVVGKRGLEVGGERRPPGTVLSAAEVPENARGHLLRRGLILLVRQSEVDRAGFNLDEDVDVPGAVPDGSVTVAEYMALTVPEVSAALDAGELTASEVDRMEDLRDRRRAGVNRLLVEAGLVPA